MDYCLRQIEHGNPYPLKIDLDDEDTVIGSDSNHTLSRYPQVSPCHAHFVKKRGGWFVRDLDSTHGTFVNSLRIGARLQKLQIGDQIGFGAKCFTDGFICALDLKKSEKKTPVVIDLIHEALDNTESPDNGSQGNVNIHWNGPSTSSAGCLNYHQCNVSYIAHEKAQLRDCFVCLVRCDSKNFKFPPDVLKVNMGNGAFEIKTVGDNAYQRQFEHHTNMNVIGESSLINCMSNIDPYQMLKKCYVSLLRCDSASFSVPYDLQPLSGNKKKLIPINTKSRCMDTSYGETSGFLLENKMTTKPVQQVEKVLESGASFRKVNRRRIISSDSSDSSDFSDDRIPDQRKTSVSSNSVCRVPGKRSNGVVSKSSLDIPRALSTSVPETSHSTINLKTLFPDVFSSNFHQQQGIKLNSAKSKRISGNKDKESCVESKNASLEYSQEDEVMIVSDVEESYEAHKLFPTAEHDALTIYDRNEMKILENIRNTLCSQLLDFPQSPSSTFLSEAAENIDISVNVCDNLGKHSFTNCSTLKHQSRFDGQIKSGFSSENETPTKPAGQVLENGVSHVVCPVNRRRIVSSDSDTSDDDFPLDDSCINSVTNHVSVLEEKQCSLNQSVKEQGAASGQSSSDHDDHSDSSVASMDYIITPSIDKNGLDALEGKKNVSFGSSEIKKNDQNDSSNSTKNNYLALLSSQEGSSNSTNCSALLNGSKNAHVDSSGGKNSLDLLTIKKNVQHDLSNRTESNYLVLLNSSKNAHVDSSEGKNSLHSSEIKKNVQHDSIKSNYLALLNSSENAHADYSKGKSPEKKARKALLVETVPLHHHSKKFEREEKHSLRKKVSQIVSSNAKILKRKHSPVALSAKGTNGIPASFKIPKISKAPQQKKGGQEPPFPKQNETSKIVSCSPLSNKKPFSINPHSKNSISVIKHMPANLRTRDFKKRPKGKHRSLMNKVINDTSNSNKLISVPEKTGNELGNVGEVGKIHKKDEQDNISNIQVVISFRIEEPCKTQSIVNSNLTVLSPPCNSFFVDKGLTSSENARDCSDPSSFSSFSHEQILSNIKDTNVNLTSSTKEAIEISPTLSTSSIAHKLTELICRTISAAQTSVSEICTSVSEIKDIVAITPGPSNSKQLNVVNFDVPKSPRSINSVNTNVSAGLSRVLEANTFTDISTSKFTNLDAIFTDPRIKLATPCVEQLPFAHEALHSGKSTVKQLFTSSEPNSPLYAPKANKLPSTSKTEKQNLAFVANSQVTLTSSTSDQLSCMNKQPTSIEFKRTPSVPESDSNLPADSPDAVASSCPEQLPRLQQRLSSTESIGKSNSVLISYLRMIKNVVSLNLKWLEEQTNNNKPPPEVSKGAASLPLSFSSFDQYVSAFVPMLMLEIWKKMFDEYKMICEHALLSNKFSFIIFSYKNHKNELEMSEYNCEAVVAKGTFEPSEGNLVIMHIDDIKDNGHQMLCYIHVHKTEQLSIANLNPVWKKVHEQTENKMLYKFSVYAKLRPMTPVLNKKMNGNGICCIKNKLILADALHKLETSPLCPSVLCPQVDVFSVNCDTSVDLSQEVAVECLSNELRKPITTPKIHLLRGPPGTGKSYIIVSLLQKLIYKEPTKVKILLTAPTDIAVDEIGCRLIKKKLNFVRFGSLRCINERIRPFTLTAKEEKLKKDYIRKNEQRKERLEKLLTEIAVMRITDSKCEKKLRLLVKEKLALEKRIFMEASVDTSHRNYQHEVLRHADVILTSLGECGDPLMSVFKLNTPLAFTCCIVDHASQCTEMDILPALAFGMSKLVLVGDPVQLSPTLTSKWTAQYGYEHSMFERFHHYFLKQQISSPSLTLQKQYRMHSEICFFPSKQFYNNGLKTPPDVDERYRKFPFHPYIVYDISERQEPKPRSSSELCADFILTICNQLLLLKKLSFSIGILVPTRDDRTVFLKKLSKQKALVKHVEVNTVEGFQGREKDMVLMSCASSSGVGRPNFLSCNRRFNVALTRARKCLIVCIGSSTLKQTVFWQNLIQDATDRHLYSPAVSIKDITLTFLPTMLKQNYIEPKDNG